MCRPNGSTLPRAGPGGGPAAPSPFGPRRQAVGRGAAPWAPFDRASPVGGGPGGGAAAGGRGIGPRRCGRAYGSNGSGRGARAGWTRRLARSQAARRSGSRRVAHAALISAIVRSASGAIETSGWWRRALSRYAAAIASGSACTGTPSTAYGSRSVKSPPRPGRHPPPWADDTSSAGGEAVPRRSRGRARARKPAMSGTGDDGAMDTVRCAWGDTPDPAYRAYHDEEWGVPIRDERQLFELLVLEGAQAGLAWSTILRKRDGYRRAFADFDVSTVAAFGDADAERLLA